MVLANNRLRDKYMKLGEVLEISDTEFFVLVGDSGVHIKDNSVQPIRIVDRNPLSINTAEGKFFASDPKIQYDAARRILCDNFCGNDSLCYGNYPYCQLHYKNTSKR